MVFMPTLRVTRAKVRITGSTHPAWKGDNASDGAKRTRARRMYVVDDCERCGKPAMDRHHRDGNPGNNDPSNVAILCRKCHMLADGRLLRLTEIGANNSKRNQKPPRPCKTCGTINTVFWYGECHKCNEYRRRNSRSRPAVTNVTEARKQFGDCPTCFRVAVQIFSHGTCKWCYRARWMKDDRLKRKQEHHTWIHDHAKEARKRGLLK